MRGDDDPLFPKTAMGKGANGGFQPAGLSQEFWSTTASVRKIVRETFQQARIRPFGPHRATLRSGASVDKVLAVSQNLGHSSMLTTLASYGRLPDDRRRELILDES